MKNNRDFTDKILEDLLNDAVNRLWDEDDFFLGGDDPIEDIQETERKDEVKNYQPSKRFQKNMEAMFQKEKLAIKRKRRRKNLPKVAAIFLVLFAIALFTVNSTTAWKEPLFNLFTKESDDGQKQQLQLDEVDVDQLELEKYLPTYIPEGFEMSTKEYDSGINGLTVEYQSQTRDFISLIILKDTTDLYLKKNNYRKLSHNKIIYYVNKDNPNDFIWKYRNHGFQLTTSLHQTENFKIANSMK